jgi:uncharacterized protein involved in high-affinity Fe2+ transport
LICTFFLLSASCNKQEDTDLSYTAFRNEKDLEVIFINAFEIKKKLSTNDAALPYTELEMIISASRNLENKYGKDRLLEYVNLLVKEGNGNKAENQNGTFTDLLDDDKCHRKADGTVDMDDCSLLETVGVLIKSAFECVKPGFAAPQQEIENYYNCVQGVVCKTC